MRSGLPATVLRSGSQFALISARCAGLIEVIQVQRVDVSQVVGRRRACARQVARARIDLRMKQHGAALRQRIARQIVQHRQHGHRRADAHRHRQHHQRGQHRCCGETRARPVARHNSAWRAPHVTRIAKTFGQRANTPHAAKDACLSCHPERPCHPECPCHPERAYRSARCWSSEPARICAWSCVRQRVTQRTSRSFAALRMANRQRAWTHVTPPASPWSAARAPRAAPGRARRADPAATAPRHQSAGTRSAGAAPRSAPSATR